MLVKITCISNMATFNSKVMHKVIYTLIDTVYTTKNPWLISFFFSAVCIQQKCTRTCTHRWGQGHLWWIINVSLAENVFLHLWSKIILERTHITLFIGFLFHHVPLVILIIFCLLYASSCNSYGIFQEIMSLNQRGLISEYK